MLVYQMSLPWDAGCNREGFWAHSYFNNMLNYLLLSQPRMYADDTGHITIPHLSAQPGIHQIDAPGVALGGECRGWGFPHLPPEMKPSFPYSLLQFVYLTSQLRHSLVVLRKILDPTMEVINKRYANLFRTCGSSRSVRFTVRFNIIF